MGTLNNLLTCSGVLATWTPAEGNRTELRENQHYPRWTRGQWAKQFLPRSLFREGLKDLVLARCKQGLG